MDDPSVSLEGLVAEARLSYASANPKSEALHRRASTVMPGGNTRSVLHFEPFPFWSESAAGSGLTDVDGNTYVDFCGNYTAGLLGHSSGLVRDAVAAAMDDGFALGIIHEREIELAELVCERFGGIESVRFTNSGTEANLMAIGTAIHFTNRRGVGVFTEGYHGGVLSFGGSGNPLNVPHDYVVAEFNDMDALDPLFGPSNDLGCVVIEAVQGSGGCRPASQEFMVELSQRCSESGTILILDEVMTSRLAPGGAQAIYGITPDMTILGKYLGGGMSFGAFGGRSDVMDTFNPSIGGQLSQAGTFNNNTASMAAAVATLRYGLSDSLLAEVNERGDRLRESLSDALAKAAPEMWVTGVGSMMCIHAEDDRWIELLFHAMMAKGHFIARRGFISLSMEVTDEQVAALVEDVADWALDSANRGH